MPLNGKILQERIVNQWDPEVLKDLFLKLAPSSGVELNCTAKKITLDIQSDQEELTQISKKEEKKKNWQKNLMKSQNQIYTEMDNSDENMTVKVEEEEQFPSPKPVSIKPTNNTPKERPKDPTYHYNKSEVLGDIDGNHPRRRHTDEPLYHKKRRNPNSPFQERRLPKHHKKVR